MTYSLQIPSIMHKAVFGNLIDDWMTNQKHVLSKKRRSFPITDVYRDQNDNQIIEMALAGYSKELIEIQVQSNQITISSNGIATDRESNIARRGFQKTFIDYNNELELGKATASLSQCLLTITISPKESAKTTTIPIL